MKKTTEVLLNAAFALTPKENWTQSTVARDANGISAPTFSQHAVSWCALGAIHAADPAGKHRASARRCFMYVVGGVSVAIFNDMTTHEAVLDALYKAAEYAEEAEWTK